VLDKSPDWILWAYKNAVRADRERLELLMAALFPARQAQPTPENFKAAGLGGLNE